MGGRALFDRRYPSLSPLLALCRLAEPRPRRLPRSHGSLRAHDDAPGGQADARDREHYRLRAPAIGDLINRRFLVDGKPERLTKRELPSRRFASSKEKGRMKQGLRFVDCDMHIMEPTDLFDKYLDPAFKSRITSATRPTDGGATGMR